MKRILRSGKLRPSIVQSSRREPYPEERSARLSARELFFLSSITAQVIKVSQSRQISLWTNQPRDNFFSHVIALQFSVHHSFTFHNTSESTVESWGLMSRKC